MKSNGEFTLEEKIIFDLLKITFSGKKSSEITEESKTIINKYGNVDWDEVAFIADKHGIISLLYDALDGGKNISDSAAERLKVVSNKIVLQNYHLVFLARNVIDLLQKNNIPVVLLKGSGISGLYPVPELRKSGDVDLLLLDCTDIDRCGDILEKEGFCKVKDQVANHHIVFSTHEKIEIEMHIMFAEPFDNKKTNEYLNNIYSTCKEHVTQTEVMGITFPVLENAYNGFYLLLHMLQHFLRSGFGLKLFCDWVVFWRQNVSDSEREMFLKLVTESGLKVFAKFVTTACVGYLGLPFENVSFMFDKEISPEDARKLSESMMLEVVEAEEFGKSSADRMVMIRGMGILAYVREFHHQMHLNFPNRGRNFVLWPVLWTYTLVRFIKNNRKLRKVSGSTILRKAKQRSRLTKQLKLFK